MQVKKIISIVTVAAIMQTSLFAITYDAYSEEVDVNGKPIPDLVNKDIYNSYPKTLKEKNGVTIVGDDLDVKNISIKKAEQLLRKKNVELDKKHPKITILKNTKGEVVYVGKNLSPLDIEKAKDKILAEKNSFKNVDTINVEVGSNKTITKTTLSEKGVLTALGKSKEKTSKQKVTLKKPASKK